MATRCGPREVRHRDPRGLGARVFLSILTSRAGARIWHRTISATRYTTRTCGRFSLCGGVGGGLSPCRAGSPEFRHGWRCGPGPCRGRARACLSASASALKRDCARPRVPAVVAAEYRNPPLGLTLILAFAPAASDGARPPLRSSHCHLTADRHPNSKTPCWLPSATNRTPGHRDDQIFHLKLSLRLNVDMNNIINLELRTFLLVFLFPTSIRMSAKNGLKVRRAGCWRGQDAGCSRKCCLK